MKKYKVVCKHCGSENITHDGWAYWDFDTQQWVLDGLYPKQIFCRDCEGDTSIDEIETETGEPSHA